MSMAACRTLPNRWRRFAGSSLRRGSKKGRPGGSAISGLGDAGGWFDDPVMMKEIARLYAWWKKLIRQPRRRTAEVAVVCDPVSAYGLTDGEGMATAHHLINDFTTELYCTGAPFDMVLADL